MLSPSTSTLPSNPPLALMSRHAYHLLVATDCPKAEALSPVSPVRLGIVALPCFPPSRSSFIEAMAFAETTGLLAGRGETT